MRKYEEELKFLIDRIPRCKYNDEFHISQYYICAENNKDLIRDLFNISGDYDTFRLRIIKRSSGTRNIVTIKGRGLLKREEYEIEVDDKIRDYLIDKHNKKIEKKRYAYSYCGYDFEFDEYFNTIDVLYTVEVEGENIIMQKEKIESILKEYFKLNYKDVTFDKKYKNINLKVK